MLSKKIGKYMGFSVYRRSYLVFTMVPRNSEKGEDRRVYVRAQVMGLDWVGSRCSRRGFGFCVHFFLRPESMLPALGWRLD